MMLKEIKKLNKQGYKIIVGLDEAGRGPLAGPVVACAAKLKIENRKVKIAIRNSKLFNTIKDSKKLSAKQRERWHRILTNHEDINYGIGIVSEKVIDKINILEATKLAMARAVRNLEKKIGKPADFLIIDGNFVLDSKYYGNSSHSATRTVPVVPVQKAIVKADEKIFLCAAASIIAKVTRDRIMIKLHKKYPQYGFDKHKGYGTKAHLRALRKHGACAIHRKSFRPVREVIKR